MGHTFKNIYTTKDSFSLNDILKQHEALVNLNSNEFLNEFAEGKSRNFFMSLTLQL